MNDILVKDATYLVRIFIYTVLKEDPNGFWGSGAVVRTHFPVSY